MRRARSAARRSLAFLDDSGPAQRRANRLRDAIRELLARRGADLRYGRTLPRALREAGLAAIHAGELDLTLAPLISAWGRRPAGYPPS